MKFREGNNGGLAISFRLKGLQAKFQVILKKSGMSDLQLWPLTHYPRINVENIVIYLAN